MIRQFLDVEIRAQARQSREVLIDGPRADGAAAWQRYPGGSGAGKQGSEHEKRGAHGFDEVVGRLGGAEGRQPGNRCIAVTLHLDPEVLEQPDDGGHVAHRGHVAKAHGLVGQQPGDELGQRRVLGAADPHRPAQRATTLDP